MVLRELVECYLVDRYKCSGGGEALPLRGVKEPALSSVTCQPNYEGRTESHKQHFFACELGTADEEECGGRWNQLLCYP